MGVKLPTFADLPSADPRAAGGLPNYPQTDPGAAGLALFGKGVADVGTAVLDFAADRQMKRDKLNESNATLDLFTRLVPLQTKIAQETDTDKIAEYRAELNTLLQTSGQPIDNPDRLQAWKANHAKTILEANAHADSRTTLLYRNKSAAASSVLIDRVVKTGVESDGPLAFEIARRGITTHHDYRMENGDLLPTERNAEDKRRIKELVEGRALYLIGKDRPNEAKALLDRHGGELDPITRGNFQLRIEGKVETLGTDAAANRALGLAPALAPSARGGGMVPGGAIGSAVDKFLDMTERHESGGRNIPQSVVGPNGGYNPSTGTVTGPSSAQGHFQITNTTWREFAPQAGVDAAQYPNAMSAPYDVQRQVARTIATTSGVQHWTDYNKNLRADVQSAGMPVSGPLAATPAPAMSAEKPVAIGDSIAAHLIRKTDGAVAGVEHNDVYKDDSTAVSGASPSVVLGTINKTPEGNIRGRDILLSTGASNNPGQIDMVADQIKALKARGARSVTVLGVGNADRVKGANDQLSEIAADNGATFAGPLRKVAGDGIHSSDPKDLLQQAQAVRATPSGPTVAPGPPAPPNRTGLPPLAEVERNIAADPTLTSDRARALAFDRAKIKYGALEADAARAERIATEAQKAAVNARITAIQQDAYSNNPTISARDIVNDPIFNNDPKMREHMIGFINNPPGSGVPAPQSYAAALNLVERIRLPEGDPQKITDLNQLYDPLVAGKLNKDDFNFAVKQFNDIRTPGGELFNKRKTEFIKRVSPMITKSNPLMGTHDPEGEGQMYNFEWLLDQKIDEYRKAGKNPADLLDPGKPDFIGKPETLRPYQSSMQEEAKQRARSVIDPPRWPSPTTPAPKAPALATGASPKRSEPAAVAPIPPLVPRNPGETPDQYLRRLGMP